MAGKKLLNGGLPEVTLLGNGVSCLFRFGEVGKRYLVYADDGDSQRFSASNCSRTRLVGETDAELEWLRSGHLPGAPVAMRREVVECDEWCDLSDAAQKLAGVEDEDSSALACDAAGAISLWKGKKPFYGSQQYEANRTVMLGRARDGRGFEIAELAPTDDKCNRRLERRWCKDLSTNPDEKGPAMRCLEPSQAEVLCDEPRTRKAHWGPLEKVNIKSCTWGNSDEAKCENELGPPMPLLASSATTPILLCRPYRYFRKGDSFRCRVQASDVVDSSPKKPSAR